MAEIPHFDLPFRYSQGVVAVNEQGSDADIVDCVFAVCATEPGQFLDLPEFGLPDPTFSQMPVPASQILGPIARWEPRAVTLAQINPSLLDEAVENANIEVGGSH